MRARGESAIMSSMTRVLASLPPSPLRRWRLAQGLSQEEAARLAGVSRQVWMRREAMRPVRAANLERIKALLMREWGKGEALGEARLKREGAR